MHLHRGLWTPERAEYAMARICLFGCGSSSSSNQTTNNDNSTTDTRVGVDASGGGQAVTAGQGATQTLDINVDSHNVATTDSHNVTIDAGAVAGAFQFGSSVAGSASATTIAGINAAADVSNRSINSNTTVTTDALKRMEAAASAAASAAQRTASDAINAITSDAADSRALARTLGVDAIQFGSDVAKGFTAAQADLNKLVGQLSQGNGEFLDKATNTILARSQSADQQNFEATLNLLKWVAAAMAAAFAVSRFAKA